MTTLRRHIDPIPSGHGVQGFAPFNVGGMLSETKTTFRPVNAGTLLEIMGYITAGLPDLGVSEGEVATLIYKWHTWLRRMNDWMRSNESRYVSILQMEDSAQALSKEDHYLGGFGSLSAQAANAESAPLGPLLPGDKGTLLNALVRGVGKTPGAGKRTERALTQFIKDVDRLAAHLAPGSRLVLPASPPTVQVKQVPLPTTLPAVPVGLVQFPSNPVPFPTATLPTATTSSMFVTAPKMETHSKSIEVKTIANTIKDLIERFKRLPRWVHVLVLMTVLLYVVKRPRVMHSRFRFEGPAPNLGPISRFSIPPVDPFI